MRCGAPPKEFALKLLIPDSPRPAAVLALVLVFILTAARSDLVQAAPARVESFKVSTFKELQATTTVPTVVIFSATWCPNCPSVIKTLATEIKRSKRKAAMIAVITDVAPLESDAILLAHPHYRQCDRLFAFDGQSAAIQYSVDPTWLGVTPYLVFMRPNAKPLYVTGAPTAAQLRDWLGSSR